MIKYLLEKIYHYSTALTSWSWLKLYGNRKKGYGYKRKKKDDYFNSKSVKQMMDEMDEL